MENKYRDALISLKKPSDSLYKAFSTSWDYADFTFVPSGKISHINENVTVQTEVKSENSAPQKQKILESFTDFAQEKLESEEKISFKGGEVKPSNSHYEFQISEVAQSVLVANSSNLLGEKVTSLRYEDKDSSTVKVLFVSDSFLDQSILEEDVNSEYNCCFESNVSELFSKMVGAMKLEQPQVLITALSSEETDKDFSKMVLDEISFFRPQFIVTLGAQATNYFIGADKKLRNHHGQLFQLKFISENDTIFETALMPLFSPKLLNIAPNMKKTAWEDMQKLMQKL